MVAEDHERSSMTGAGAVAVPSVKHPPTNYRKHDSEISELRPKTGSSVLSIRAKQ